MNKQKYLRKSKYNNNWSVIDCDYICSVGDLVYYLI